MCMTLTFTKSNTMRTVDPEDWSKFIRKAPLNLSRPMRFGKKAHVIESKISGFHEALKEYKRNCSVSGVKYITDERNPAFIRYSYAVVLCLLVCFGVSTLVMNGYERALSESSTVSARAHTAVRDVPFPAVALCSNHVITTSALNNYTATLMAKKQYRNRTYSEEAISRNLAYLGHLLTMSKPPDLDTSFVSYVASLDLTATEAGLLYKFSPKCSSMLVRCSWRGQTLPCQDLFHTRLTPLGYCCVFNSRYHPRDVYKVPQFLDLVGKDYGLAVVVQQDNDDVSFYRRSSHDIDVLIFDGDDYPLLEGGGARLFSAEGGASVHLALRPTLHYTEEGFHHDVQTPCRSRRWSGPRPARSRAWCVSSCRARALADLCACTLLTLPPPPPPPHDHARKTCSLDHLDCLNRHREKLVQYHPLETGSSSPVSRDAHDCTQCAPDCARVVYTASSAVTSHTRHQTFKDQLTNDISSENVTTIRIFYSSRQVMSYVFHSNAAWYEKFVHLGSEWALIVGASVVSVAELAFHCCLRTRRHTGTRGITVVAQRVNNQ